MTTTKWTLDPMHSELGFKVKHLMISNVTGFFKTFTAEVDWQDADFSNATITLNAQMASITTNNEQRDAHLRNADFFDVERYPEMIFQSSRIEKIDDGAFSVQGSLTLKAVTKPVTLDVEFSGLTKDMHGGEKVGFTVNGKINRKDWGLTYNAIMETGGLALSEEVKIQAEIQLIKQVIAAVA